MDNKSFLIREKSGRSAKPYVLTSSYIFKWWSKEDLEETDDDGETSLKSYIDDSEIGDKFITNDLEFERIP